MSNLELYVCSREEAEYDSFYEFKMPSSSQVHQPVQLEAIDCNFFIDVYKL